MHFDLWGLGPWKKWTLLKSNEPNSISKDVLRDEGCPWFINYTTQKYFIKVRQDSHFNKRFAFSATYGLW